MHTSSTPGTPPSVVIINVFTVPAGRSAEELLQLLREVTTAVMQHQPGFVSAELHVSLDGTHVVNYAVWESEAAFGRVMQLPEARAHFAHTQTFPRDVRFYRVTDTFTAQSQP